MFKYLREVCETHETVTTKSNKVLALLDLANAFKAYRDAELPIYYALKELAKLEAME